MDLTRIALMLIVRRTTAICLAVHQSKKLGPEDPRRGRETWISELQFSAWRAEHEAHDEASLPYKLDMDTGVGEMRLGTTRQLALARHPADYLH